MNVEVLGRDVALPRILHGQVSAVCVVDDELRHRVAWFDGLRKEIPDGPTFKRPTDAVALAHVLNGESPTPRGRAQPTAPSVPAAGGLRVGLALEAPESATGASSARTGLSPQVGPGAVTADI